MSEPAEYVQERVRHALAEDPRLGELGVEVVIDADEVVLTGKVSSPENRTMAEAVASELAPEHRIRNELEVVAYQEPEGPSP